MDVISRLRDACGLDENEARAVAGGVLGLMEEELLARHGFEAARSFETELPELASWRVDALRFFGQAGRSTHGEPRFGAIFEQVLDEQVPKSEEKALMAMLRDLGATVRGRTAAGLLLQFLKARLSWTLLNQLLDTSPMLRRADADLEAP